MIEIEELTKSFGEVKALDGVSLSVPDGRIVGLLGPNGAGKTTALRIVCTLLSPDSGQALIDGFDSSRDGVEVRQRLGALPAERRGLYPRLTARENIRYFGRLQGLLGEALEARIEELMQLLDMAEIADRRTEGFSTGQQLKVAIARALIHDPRNVLFDEPTNGLDVMTTRALRDVLRRLRDDGRAVLFSSHVMQEVAALCEDIVVVDHGRVVASGTPEEIRERSGEEDLEEAFIQVLGSAEGLA
ncbi:MAG: ATP-binding cassette domain-containing protein [Acidobacteriota bacterium]